MRTKIWLSICFMGMARMLPAQNSDQVKNYINTYKFLAISEMQRSGVPASIILAQGIHETQAGTSELVISSNNHFGIKCKSGWTGQVVYHDDDARGECFRSYASAADSYRDHSDYLSQTPRYAFLFRLNPEDYESWAYGLKKAGYATNLRYSQILIKLIQDYDLENYSLIALGKLPPDDLKTGVAPNQALPVSLQGFTDSAMQKPASAGYPEGPFSINAAKVVYAKAGVSLLSLSNEYEIPLAHLLEFNELKQEDVLIGDQLIFLQRKRKIGESPLHIVQPGETVYTICQTEGIRYESIMEYNRLKPGEEPAPGEKLYLQTMSNAKPKLRNQGDQGNANTAIPSS
jgi:LysM repeat protein